MKPSFKRVAFGVFLSLFDLSLGFSQESLPYLDQVLITVSKNFKDKSPIENRKIHFRVKESYYRILSDKNQLNIAEEVKNHFEKAISKAEDKFDEGSDLVSQSDITKLQLGLFGILNDIIELKSEIHQSRISLGLLMGNEIPSNFEMQEKQISPMKFPFQNWESFLMAKTNSITGTASSSKTKTRGLFKNSEAFADWHKAFFKIEEARGKIKLAIKARKMTRAFLVTEVANHDFGIGNSGDLFEALIIYTRVLRGYFQSIYRFNVAVAEFEKLSPLMGTVY